MSSAYKNYDRFEMQSNVFVLCGYAALFVLLHLYQPQLDRNTQMIVGILAGASLLIFIASETYKRLILGRMYREQLSGKKIDEKAERLRLHKISGNAFKIYAAMGFAALIYLLDHLYCPFVCEWVVSTMG